MRLFRAKARWWGRKENRTRCAPGSPFFPLARAACSAFIFRRETLDRYPSDRSIAGERRKQRLDQRISREIRTSATIFISMIFISTIRSRSRVEQSFRENARRDARHPFIALAIRGHSGRPISRARLARARVRRLIATVARFANVATRNVRTFRLHYRRHHRMC